MIDDLFIKIEAYKERLREARMRIYKKNYEDYEYEEENDGEDEEYLRDEYIRSEIPDEIVFEADQEIIDGHEYYRIDAIAPKPYRYSVSADNPWYFEIDGVVFSKETGLLILFPPGKGEEYTFPDDERITGIGDRAFAGNSHLKKINISDRIRYIGEDAFRRSMTLEEISIPSSVEYVGRGALEGCASLKKADLNFNLRGIPDHLLYYCAALESITYPSDITEIGLGAFAECFNLKTVWPTGDESRKADVILSPGIHTIGREAFRDCRTISSVFLSDSVKILKIGAFKGCESLRIINTESVEEYGGGCFQKCNSLESFEFSSNTRIIRKEIFFDSNNLKTIRFSCAPSMTCVQESLPDDVEYIVNAREYMQIPRPYSCKKLFLTCVKNIIQGETVTEDLLNKAVQILKRRRGNLFDWFLEDKQNLLFILNKDILDCDSCVDLIKYAETRNAEMAEIVRTYMYSHFKEKKISSALCKWEEKEQQRKEKELLEQRMREEKERMEAELLTRNSMAQNITLEEMDLSVRAYNCLRRLGISMMSDLIGLTDENLLKIPSLDMRCVKEIRARMNYLLYGGELSQDDNSLDDLDL